MVDFAIITTALGGIKSATEIAKYLNGANASLDKAETKMKIAELITALADAKIAIADIKEVILDKDHRISDLENEQTLKAKVKYEKPYYWIIDGEHKDGPYCQQCYDKDSKLIRLQAPARPGYWECKTCKSGYTDNAYTPHVPKVIKRSPLG